MARKHTSDLSHTAMNQISVLRQKSPCVAQAGFTCLVILSDGRHSRPLIQSVVKPVLMLRKLRQEDHSMSHTTKPLKKKSNLDK